MRSRSGSRTSRSRNDDLMWWLILGGLALSTSSRGRTREQAAGRWVWPLARLSDGRRPVISDGYHLRKGPPPVMHEGVDLMFRRPRKIVGTFPFPDFGSPMFECPAVPVLAAADGKIWSAGVGARGHFVVIDHGKAGGGRSTFYQHLASLDVPAHKGGKRVDGSPAMSVTAGEPIGVTGYDPTDRRKVRHLHFELRDGRTPFDPADLMSEWEIV